MNSKAIWKYFLDINMFNVPFCIIIAFMTNVLWAVIVFSSFGILIGYLVHRIFKKNEYYTYYNLGFTKRYLLKKVGFINILISSLIIATHLMVR